MAESVDKDLNELLTLLRATYRRAQEPSLREISRLCQRRISPSTISRIFNASKPPKWRNLETLLDALGVDPDDLEQIWYPLWAKAQNKVNPIEPGDRPVGRLHPRQADKICEECGALIGDAGKHRAYHASNRPTGHVERGLRAIVQPGRRTQPRVPARTR
ncbi:helix-turn-helix domain-containing protein [Asanoa siamensis]|uniref:HTH cro/C1-type domain-containing protein n=1 Tax=Asanoa siamensis TaxID=926357 RepID=A0ABQ4CQZ9_9ACTN|nr:helix-turn-helix transcriptional regulator [Asanoa siamensis]GIF73700.1 hypothetical protein Asi02nite_32180 [Asanoa siamensis]